MTARYNVESVSKIYEAIKICYTSGMTISEKFKQVIRLKKTWALVIVVSIGAFIVITRERGPQIEYITEAARRGTLTQTVSATGSIESTASLNLNFEVSGTLREIYVREGDHVEAGQEVAKLDTTELDKQVARVAAELSAARANLQKVLEGATSQEILVSQRNVDSGKVAYENAVRDDAALRVKLDADIVAAETALTDTITSREQAITDARTNLLTVIEGRISQATHALDQVKVIFDDVDLRPTFSVSNYQYRTDASHYYDRAIVQVVVAHQALATAKQVRSDASLLSAVQAATTAFSTTNLSLENSFLAVGASLTNYSFTPTKQETYKTSLKSHQSAMDAAISAVDGAYQTYINSQLTRTTAVNSAQANLDAARAIKEVQLAASTAKISSAKAAYDLAVAQHQQRLAPPRASDVAFYRGQVAQAEATFASIQHQRDLYTLRAPIAGVITFVNYKIGELIVAAAGVSQNSLLKPAFSMLGDAPFRIRVDVSESNIVKVKLGDPAHITLDAFTEDDVVRGTVSRIDIAETVIADVVYYRVTVDLDDTALEIKTGMTANVDIITDTRDNAIIIPQRAVREEAGQRSVRVLKNNRPEQRVVTTGLRGDDGLVEALSGISEGDEVIIFERQK